MRKRWEVPFEILREGVPVWNKTREMGWLDGVEAIDFNGADLTGADLRGANLARVKLYNADLSRASLAGADLSTASLNGAMLWKANLREADLRGADLRAANFSEANFSEANLRGADLRGAVLIRARLCSADLTGTRLWGANLTEWNIADVKCECCFFDSEGEIYAPSGRDFDPGEFERLYAHVVTIELALRKGCTPFDLAAVGLAVDHINGENPEYELQVRSLELAGLHPIVQLAINDPASGDHALQKLVREHEHLVANMTGRLKAMDESLARAMARPVMNIGPGSIVTLGPDSPVFIDSSEHHVRAVEAAIDSSDSSDENKGAARTLLGEAIEAVKSGAKEEAKSKLAELSSRAAGTAWTTAVTALVAALDL